MRCVGPSAIRSGPSSSPPTTLESFRSSVKGVPHTMPASEHSAGPQLRAGFAITGNYQAVDYVRIACAAEAAGFDSFWLTEGGSGGRDAIGPLTWVARQTERIRLGTSVLTIFTRSAPLIA